MHRGFLIPFSARQLAVQLSPLPVSISNLPENLPRLAARTINLPVHAIKLATHLIRLPISLASLPIHSPQIIAAYNLLITKPRDARVTGKTVTGNIDTEFDGLDESLGIMDDLIPQFAPANQKFVDDYNNARRIVDAAASHASPNQPTPAPTPAAKKA
jgi:hypothetical protein